MPEPDLVSGFDEGDFTYDEYDDIVRDLGKYTSNLDLSSPPAADQEVQDPSVRDLLQTIRETTNRDAAAIRNSCLLYTSPSPRDGLLSRMPSSA